MWTPDAHILVTLAALAVDTSICAIVALRFAPPRAARLVEAQAGPVFDRTMKPRLAVMLAQERVETLAEVKLLVAAQGEDLAKRFDVVREEARSEAAAQIAAAQESLKEQAAALEADARAKAEAVMEEAKRESARFLAGRSAQARAVQEVVEGEAEARISTWVLRALGGNEFLATRVVRWVQGNAPKAWKAAIRNPEEAPGILGSVLGMAQESLAASQGGAAASSPADDGF